MDAIVKKWEVACTEFLVGKKIINVRYLNDAEVEDLGWHAKSLVIFFDDGSYIFSSADDEGNEAGALFTSDENLSVIPVI